MLSTVVRHSKVLHKAENYIVCTRHYVRVSFSCSGKTKNNEKGIPTICPLRTRKTMPVVVSLSFGIACHRGFDSFLLFLLWNTPLTHTNFTLSLAGKTLGNVNA